MSPRKCTFGPVAPLYRFKTRRGHIVACLASGGSNHASDTSEDQAVTVVQALGVGFSCTILLQSIDKDLIILHRVGK
jgi:hypothetical protein